MAAYAIQFRRGTTTQHNSFTGLLGEVTVDTDKKTLVVHDGTTTGGFPLAREGANLASAEGSFTSNVTVGGTLEVTSTASFTNDVTIAGDLGMTGHVIPSANVTYDLGSTTMMWRDVYVGPGSLYINGQKVLEDNSGTIKMSADENQNIKIESSGTGALQFVGAGGLQIQGEINALTGDLQFGDHLDMNSNRIKEVSAPVESSDAANKAYVDGQIVSVSSGGTLSFDGVDGDFSGNVAVTGNLTVSGTMTTVNSETIELADNILLLNSNATGTASQNGGIEVERGDDLNVQFLWDETNNRWSVGAEDIYTSGKLIGDVQGEVTGTVSSLTNHDTDDLSEGGNNLYYTNSRVDTRFQTNWNAKDTDDLPEGSTNLYHTRTRVEGIFDDKLGADNTDSLSEGGTNLYFTDERAQDAALKNVSAGNNISVSYDETTNVLTVNSAVATTDISGLSGRLDVVEGSATTAGSIAKALEDAKAYTDQADEAKAYTDTRETAIETAYEAYADAAEVDAKAYTDTRETEITSAYTSAISTAVAGKDNTDEITEGSTNLYYTDARADARVANATGANLSIASRDTDDLSEGTSNLYFTDARAVAAVKSALSMTHSGVYVVTSTDDSGNATTSHAITASDLGFNLAGKEYYQVFLNRQLLRPTEFTVNSSNGTITFSPGTLATDDELEAVMFG